MDSPGTIDMTEPTDFQIRLELNFDKKITRNFDAIIWSEIEIYLFVLAHEIVNGGVNNSIHPSNYRINHGKSLT
jgi:hypothetical protein